MATTKMISHHSHPEPHRFDNATACHLWDCPREFRSPTLAETNDFSYSVCFQISSGVLLQTSELNVLHGKIITGLLGHDSCLDMGAFSSVFVYPSDLLIR